MQVHSDVGTQCCCSCGCDAATFLSTAAAKQLQCCSCRSCAHTFPAPFLYSATSCLTYSHVVAVLVHTIQYDALFARSAITPHPAPPLSPLLVTHSLLLSPRDKVFLWSVHASCSLTWTLLKFFVHCCVLLVVDLIVAAGFPSSEVVLCVGDRDHCPSLCCLQCLRSRPD